MPGPALDSQSVNLAGLMGPTRLPSHRQQPEARHGHQAEHRDGTTGCSRGEDQLEQRHRIAYALPETAERAVPAIGDDEHALAGKRRDGDTQKPPATAGERTPPHVHDREQERRRNGGVSSAEGQGQRR